MDLNEYQRLTNTTAMYPGKAGYLGDITPQNSYDLLGLLYVSLGLVGEAGEIANKVKKIIRDNDGIISEEMHDALVKEYGDVLWYLAQSLDLLGVPFSSVAQANLDKLQKRKEAGKIQGSGDSR